jgi:hemolysin III
MEPEGKLREEFANWITHGVGLTLSLVGAALLITLAILRGTIWHIATVSVYACCLIALYASSTAYHACRSEKIKRIFRIADHSAIYLLIAGTYTPFTLINMRGGWGWTLFATVWTLTLVGILWKVFFLDRYEIVSILLYVAMGWLALIAIKPLLLMVPLGALIWLFAGGSFYSTGLIFFASRRIPFAHAVWHVFVMAGSACHYAAVIWYVLPRAGT